MTRLQILSAALLLLLSLPTWSGLQGLDVLTECTTLPLQQAIGRVRIILPVAQRGVQCARGAILRKIIRVSIQVEVAHGPQRRDKFA